jgi:hypothetical protein
VWMPTKLTRWLRFDVLKLVLAEEGECWCWCRDCSPLVGVM